MNIDTKVRFLETLDDATNMITLSFQSENAEEKIRLLNAAKEYIEDAKKLVMESDLSE